MVSTIHFQMKLMSLCILFRQYVHSQCVVMHGYLMMYCNLENIRKLVVVCKYCHFKRPGCFRQFSYKNDVKLKIYFKLLT